MSQYSQLGFNFNIALTHLSLITLPIAHVQPLPELKAHLLKVSNFFHSKFFMQGHTGGIGQGDAADDYMLGVIKHRKQSIGTGTEFADCEPGSEARKAPVGV